MPSKAIPSISPSCLSACLYANVLATLPQQRKPRVHLPATCAAQGAWRTPHPDPNPLDGPTAGLSGAVAVAMVYLPDGTVVFTERPHTLANGIPNNPLIVDVSSPKVTLH